MSLRTYRGQYVSFYDSGLIAEARDDKAAAKAAWQKLLPLMPEGSSQRQHLEARIAKLGSCRRTRRLLSYPFDRRLRL